MTNVTAADDPAPDGLPVPPWPSDVAFPRYSESEYADRWMRFRELLDEVGAGAAIVTGHAAGRAEVQHLANAPVRWESVLVFPADPSIEPQLLVQLDNHASGIRPWAIVPTEVSGPDLAGRTVAMVSRYVSAGQRVALLGPTSAKLAEALRAGLAGHELVGVGAAFVRGRQVKSAEELRWTRYGAAICDHAVARFLREARAGLREDELGAILTHAVASAGGQLGICFLASSSMHEGGTPAPRQTWSRRLTTSDDLVMFELSAGFGGATGQVLRTVSLGGEPTDVIRRAHAIADAAYARLLEAIRPGLRVAVLEQLGGEIEGAGFTIVDDLVHGYGGGYLRPHVRTPGTRREDPSTETLVAGQLLVIQPNVTTTDGRFGVQTGDLVHVTVDGPERLHLAPRGLLQVGS